MHPEFRVGSDADPAESAPVLALAQAADLAYREARWDDAAHDYGLLTRQVPDDAYSWFRLGNSRSQQGQFDSAVLAYEAAIERNARDPRPWLNLSTVYLLHAQKAMTHAWQALPIGDPTRVVIETRLYALGQMLNTSDGSASAQQVGSDRR